MDEEEIRQKLTPEEYKILREKGTERPFSGIYYDHHENGVYKCKVCNTPLFDSKNKFDSGCGWPSFDKVTNKDNVTLHSDISHGMTRTEVICKTCGSHLGHVFPDGPKETTGERFCINSVCLNFEPKET